MMTDEMGIFDTLYNCRAMRRLDSREVPEELLVKLVDAANQAPSGSNMQNGRWILVRDPAVKSGLAKLNEEAVKAYVGPHTDRPGALPHQSEEKRRRMLQSVLWQMEHLHEIPALIIACLDLGAPADAATIAGGAGSIWPGVQNLLLAARALGSAQRRQPSHCRNRIRCEACFPCRIPWQPIASFPLAILLASSGPSPANPLRKSCGSTAGPNHLSEPFPHCPDRPHHRQS